MSDDKNSILHELDLIQQKKVALQRLVKLTASMNRLSQGLQSVLVLGKKATAIPGKIVQSFKAITERLSPLPTPKLQNSLSATQIKIQSDIRQVLQLSQKQEAELDEYLRQNHLFDAGFSNYVDDFKKKSQTSIALRIVLQERNAGITPFQLPVPETFIQKQIQSLEKKEEKYRTRVKNELVSLINDVDSLLETSNLPEEITHQLQESRIQIMNNFYHFNAGHNIEEMPILFENIEMTEADQPEEVELEEVPPTPAAEPDDEVIAEVEEIEIKPADRGLGSRMWEWATTPMDHSWNDISKKEKKD